MYTHIYTYILTQSSWTGTKVIRRKHIVQPTGFGACSSTCCQWDGEDVPAPWEWSNSHPPVHPFSVPVYTICHNTTNVHNDVIKWKQFPRHWLFVRVIRRSPANSPHKGQWRGALMFSLICAWINCWANNGEAGGLRRHNVLKIFLVGCRHVMSDYQPADSASNVTRSNWPRYR